MYHNPHNKISGRNFIDNKDEGIKICLETLNDPESHRDDILSSVCYMGYRVLDGSYQDSNFVYQKILMGHELSKTINPPVSPAWFRVRWEASYLMLRIYFEYLIMNMPFPTSLLTELTNIKIEDHPPQFVNMQRAHLFLFAKAHFEQNLVEQEKYVCSAVLSYKKAVANYQPYEDRPHVFIYESWEAMECLTTMMQLKFADSKKMITIKDTWKSKCKDKSRGSMFRVLLKIYDDSKTV